MIGQADSTNHKQVIYFAFLMSVCFSCHFVQAEELPDNRHIPGLAENMASSTVVSGLIAIIAADGVFAVVYYFLGI